MLREPMPVRLRSRSPMAAMISCCFAGVAEVVEFGRGSRADHAGFGCGGGGSFGRGFFEFFTDVGELVDSSWRSRRRSLPPDCGGVRKFFRTGSCARDLRSARSSRRAARPRVMPAGEAFEILNAAECPCGFRRPDDGLLQEMGYGAEAWLRWCRDR